ncbi:hypothetical protein PAPYR_6300 [Paratrimastix pyriformis]|uniref:Uncharacterized protein n=1 Tax=Paratrimastix pyriformis TaxID=342808 RepID=A0ABQ8UFI9_9EUKA|nr:hypothetical protein PAPYR_6300 [Paratrimastix pyriformis]
MEPQHPQPSVPTEPQQCCEKAIEVASQGNVEAAIAMLSPLAGSGDLKLIVLLGELLESQGHSEEALSTWRRGLLPETHPSFAQHNFRLLSLIAQHLNRQGATDAPADVPSDHVAQWQLGKLHESLATFSSALTLAEIPEDRAEVQASIALLYQALGSHLIEHPPISTPGVESTPIEWFRRAVEQWRQIHGHYPHSLDATLGLTRALVLLAGEGNGFPRVANPLSQEATDLMCRLLEALGRPQDVAHWRARAQFFGWLPDFIEVDFTPATAALHRLLDADQPALEFEGEAEDDGSIPAGGISGTTVAGVGGEEEFFPADVVEGEAEADVALPAGVASTRRKVTPGANHSQKSNAARRRRRFEAAVRGLLADRTELSTRLLAALCWQHGCCGELERLVFVELERRAQTGTGCPEVPAGLLLGGEDDEDIRPYIQGHAASASLATLSRGLLLLLLLRGESPCTLRLAGQALARLGERRALPTLLKLLPKDVKGLYQTNAAGSLAALGDPLAIEPLLKLLNPGAAPTPVRSTAPRDRDLDHGDEDAASAQSDADLMLDRPAAQQARLRLATIQALRSPGAADRPLALRLGCACALIRVGCMQLARRCEAVGVAGEGVVGQDEVNRCCLEVETALGLHPPAPSEKDLERARLAGLHLHIYLHDLASALGGPDHLAADLPPGLGRRVQALIQAMEMPTGEEEPEEAEGDAGLVGGALGDDDDEADFRLVNAAGGEAAEEDDDDFLSPQKK